MIVRELNKINIEHNGRTISINFASFSFDVINERLLIYDNSELVLVLPAEKELINQAYAAINIKGKQGERGIQGVKGDKGDEGKAGKDGAKGDAGEKGDTGEKGENGTNGVDGRDGKDGINGINGQRGEIGIAGKDGKDGKDGKNGSNGTNGIDGSNGQDGKNGSNGRNGVNGSDGISFNFRGDWNEESTYQLNDVVRLEKALFIAKVETTERPVLGSGDISEEWALFLLDGHNGRNGRDGIDGGATTNTNKLLSTTVIDCTTLSTTSLYTVPVGKNLFIEQAYALLTDVSGGTGINKFPKVSIGTSGSNNINMPTRLKELDVLNEYYHFNTTAVKKLATATESVDFLVNLQSNAVTYTLTLYLFGYEF